MNYNHVQEHYRIAAQDFFVWKPSQDIIKRCNRVYVYVKRGLVTGYMFAWAIGEEPLVVTELKPSSNGLSHAMGTYPAYVNRLIEVQRFFSSNEWELDILNSGKDMFVYKHGEAEARNK